MDIHRFGDTQVGAGFDASFIVCGYGNPDVTAGMTACSGLRSVSPDTDRSRDSKVVQILRRGSCGLLGTGLDHLDSADDRQDNHNCSDHERDSSSDC